MSDMLTRVFDEPVPVRYRADSHWVPAWAFGVRRAPERYEVLIGLERNATRGEQIWVKRSLVRAVSGHHW